MEADTSIKSQQINGYKSIESVKTVNSTATVALKNSQMSTVARRWRLLRSKLIPVV